MTETEICKLADIVDNDAKGMVAVVDGKQRNIVVVRKSDRAFA